MYVAVKLWLNKLRHPHLKEYYAVVKSNEENPHTDVKRTEGHIIK